MRIRNRLGLCLIVMMLFTVSVKAQIRSTYLTVIRDQDLVIVDTASGMETVLVSEFRSDNPQGFSPWSPDGSTIAYVMDQHINVLNVETGEQINFAYNAQSDPNSLTWSADGSRLAAVVQDEMSQRPDIAVFEPETRAMFTIPGWTDDTLLSSIDRLNWSPDGTWLAYVLRSYDPQQNAEISQFLVITAAIGATPIEVYRGSPVVYSWTPNSHELVYAGTGSDGQGHYFRVNVETAVQNILSVPFFFEFMVWSPDITRMMHSSNGIVGEANAELRLYDLNTGEMRVLASAFQIDEAEFSPDGERVGYVAATQFWGDRLNIVDLQTGQNQEIAAVEFGDIRGWTWSPDGSMIAYGVPAVDSGQEPITQIHVVSVDLAESRLIADRGRFWGWSPDSSWLAYRLDRDVYVVDVFTELTRRIENVDQVIGWRPV